jgi:hypothetical protein
LTIPDELDPTRGSLGRALGSQYRILRLLGRGGMGAVYLARDEALERLVAVKVLRPEMEVSPTGASRFRREARTAAQLNHPHIVPLYAFGEVDGLVYFIMAYVQGESLAARLEREGRLPAEEVRRIVADLAEALDYAHRKGVVHRDVKPENILLEDETGRAVLADFGIAKGLGGSGVTGTVGLVGTPQYMSPEQAAGDPTVDARSDLYSLGLVAWRMLAGRPAFAGATPEALLRRLSEEPPPIREASPELAEDLASAVSRCLRRRREDRWPSARALREAIAPTTLEADELPEPLDTLDGAIPALLPPALGLGALSLMWAAGEVGLVRGIVGAALLAFLVMQLPIRLSAARLARRRGFTRAQVVGALLRQPAWWPLWYPARFRRAADVWARLPRPFLVWRGLASVLAGVLLAGSLAAALVQHADKLLAPIEALVPASLSYRVLAGMLAALMAAAALLVIGLAATAIVCARRVRAADHDPELRRRVLRTMLMAPTSARAAWRKAEIAALFVPAALGPGRSPQDLVRAIGDLARASPPDGREVLAEALAAARLIADAIAECDRRLARAARHLDDSEADRLRDRLAALREDGGEESQLRALLAQQVAWHERAAEAAAAARRAREGLHDRLAALWRAADDARRQPAAAAASDRLRALCSLPVDAEPASWPEAPTATRAR